MDPTLEGHRRYLNASNAVCSQHPLVHSHQLAALEREIALAAASAGMKDYRIASGDLFELTRAGWLDRVENNARVAVLAGDRWMLRAAEVEYAHAAEAISHLDWPARLATGMAQAATLTAHGGEAAACFTRLLLGVIRLRDEARLPQKEELAAATTAAHRALCAVDRGFTWSYVRKQPHYALRMPWNGSGLDVMGKWIGDFIGNEPAPDAGEPNPIADDPLSAIRAAKDRWRSELSHRPPGPVSIDDGATADVTAPYRTLAESITSNDRTAAAIREAAISLVRAGSAASSPGDALARFVSEGLLARLASAPLQAQAEQGLERRRVWPDPLIEHHYRSLLENLARCCTTTEVDLIAAYANACFAVEADWNVLFLCGLFGPLRAACSFRAEKESALARENLQGAVAATHSLLGLGPEQLLAVPRVTGFMDAVRVALAPEGTVVEGAFRGEAGFDFLKEARLCVETMREERDSRAFDPTAPESILELCRRGGVASPATSPLSVSLWETLIAPENLVGELARPKRPPVPGMTF